MRPFYGIRSWIGCQLENLPSAHLTSAVVTLMQRRGQYGDNYHSYLSHSKVAQTDSTDTFLQAKQESQMWNHTEQWEGYSKNYLKRWMQYTPTLKNANRYEYQHVELDSMLEAIYSLYGAAADILLQIEEDPLHPNFHELLQRARQYGKLFTEAIDKRYNSAHPTHKLLYDAWMVKRHYQLEDWYILVVRRRQRILNRLTPEWIEEQQKGKRIAEIQMEKLRQLGEDLEENPLKLLETPNWSKDEVEILHQRVKYFRKIRKYGAAFRQGDLHPA